MTALFAGVALGLAAGISPGPLQAMVITATIQRGFGGGWRVAIAPLLTDAPIVALAVTVLAAVPEAWVRALGLGGGVIVTVLGIIELRNARRPLPATAAPEIGDVWRGALVNAVSPHPWIFWAAVGGPALVRAWREAPALGVAFVVGFYVLLVGSKVALAWVVAAGRQRLSDRWRRRLLAAGGTLLVVAGGVLIAGSL